MPFTDEQPFLDAILARYHDDGPRFIYADFLDDAGDPLRAELVRVQVALARMNEDHPKQAELKNREVELLEAHRPRWCDHLSDLVSVGQCEFQRGVLDSIVLDATDFLEKGAELFGRVRLRTIRLRESESMMAKIAASPLIGSVHELVFFGNSIGNGGLNLLARSPYLKNLAALDLGFSRIDDSGVGILARASTLPNLTSLSLGLNDLTSASMTELAASPFFGGLTALDIPYNQIDVVGIKAIASSQSLSRLNTLRLKENCLGDAGIVELARSTLFGRILTRSPRLDIRKNEIGSEGIAELAASPLLNKCISLDLNHNEIGDRGFASIVGSQYLQNLRILKAGHNRITDRSINSLRDHWPRNLGQLRFVDLSDNELSYNGCKDILDQAKKIPSAVVDVARNKPSSSGAEPPVSVGDVVQDTFQGVSELAEAAELRRRVSHPYLRGVERPNPPG